MKEKQYNELLVELGKCKKCTNLKSKNSKDCSLINLYKDNKFCKNIPSIWTDWFNRLDPKINIKDFIIIPLYHPVAQIKKSEQLEQYKRKWKYID